MSSVGLATFGAGRFWEAEEVFAALPAVFATSVGYTGGVLPHPTFAEVEGGTSGHVEAVRVEYDADRVAYDELLELFFDCHDPARRRRRSGPGSQYRSIVFCHNNAQRTAAIDARTTRERQLGRRLATEIVRATLFHRAEEWHQRYLERARTASREAALAR